MKNHGTITSYWSWRFSVLQISNFSVSISLDYLRETWVVSYVSLPCSRPHGARIVAMTRLCFFRKWKASGSQSKFKQLWIYSFFLVLIEALGKCPALVMCCINMINLLVEVIFWLYPMFFLISQEYKLLYKVDRMCWVLKLSNCAIQ